MSALPLDGVRVLEVASHVLVPMAGSVLGEWGASVIKVEDPSTGDPYRSLATFGLHNEYRGVDPFFQSANRGKHSVTLDLRQEEGRALLSRLIAEADVFMTSFTADAREKLHIDVDDVRADNPSIVYVRGTAFGPQGPDARRGGYDYGAYWARSGMQHLFTAPTAEWPAPLRPAFGDVAGGMAIAGAVSAAMFRSVRTGEPSVIDVSLLATGMWQVQTDIVNAGLGEGPTPSAGGPPQGRYDFWNPLWLTYRSADGRFITLMMLSADRYWAPLCERIGRPDLISDPRFVDMDARKVNSRACIKELEATFSSRTLDEWHRALDGFEGEWIAMQTPAEVHHDPQVQANGYVADVEMPGDFTIPLVPSPVQFDGRPGAPTRAPEHGEHTETTLVDHGVSWEDIVGLKDRGVIR